MSYRGAGSRPAVIWLNGPFGVGKTTTASRLVAGREALRVFDPESIGTMLVSNLRGRDVEDFQDLPAWRALVPVVAEEVAGLSGDQLVAVQTVLDQGYWREILDGFSVRGRAVRHVLLDARESVLRSRIDRDPDGRDLRAWRHGHVDAYLAARGWMMESAEVVLDTSDITPDAAARSLDTDLGSTSA